jgi:Tfp pilus assembly protein PilO
MNQKIALYTAGAAGLSLLWYFVVFSIVNTELDTMRARTTEVQAQLADYTKTVKELPAFLAANDNLEQLRSELNSSLFAKGDILQLFRQLADDASSHNLELVQISPPVEELLELNRQALLDNEPQFLNVTLDLKGQYLDFGRFMTDLEARPYFRTINTCVIRGNPDLQPTVNMAVSFKALIGTLEEPA